jgi:phage baseplate assembly protein W
MAIEPARLGTYLHLLSPLDRGDDRTTGGDLRTGLRKGIDLAVVAGADNLSQALLLRLLTPRGALEALGHPAYGSRLHTLIGEPNTETNRNRARLFVLEVIAQEPRIRRVLALSVTTNRTANPTRIDISVNAEVAESGEVINLVFPFFLG